ncbi:RlpA-like double-psi beta-barrel-protein domain-containing protein-containing protein [Paraphoma chrysanthemicola]|nr:RlpA-like double-psi beta-barrel-protein domain-containing protein-containing protein [Paraphoma chrysanthemicola]
MKSSVLALLPFASVALAKSACSRKVVTSTHFVYDSVTVTPTVVKQATPEADTTPTPAPVLSSSTCSRRTVTTTEIEKVTVTVEAGEEPVKTIDVTSTSTTHITTTITIRPTPAPSALSSSLQWGPYPNATFTSGAGVKPTSKLPEFSVVSPTPAGEAAAPTYPASTPEAPEASATVPSSETPSPPTEVDSAAAGSKSGEATFYGGNTAGGMCSFTGYTLPSSLFGTALSDSNWAGAGSCGRCVSVTGPSGTKVTAMITDQCPGCGPNHLDLYPNAFAKLADPSKGVIPVSWDFVPCGITTPLVLKNKSGTSKFWFSMQVMNANVGVAKLDVSTDGGKTWKPTTRQPYNFFENSAGFGTDSVDVKVTSVDGKTVVVKGVSIAADTTKTAGGNF